MRDLPVFLVAAAAAVLTLTWVVYPLWLRLRAGRSGRRLPTAVHGRWPRVTIVVVVRNGTAELRHLLPNLLGLAYPADRRRILVVSAASTDFSDALVRLYADRGVGLLRVMRAGAGVENHVRRLVEGEIVVRVHPRARLEPSALAALVTPFADPSVGVVYGREVAADERGRPLARESAYRRFESRLRERETRVFGTASARATLYAVRGALYRAPVPGGYSPDFAEALTAREHGYRAVYVEDATCTVRRERSRRADYGNTMHAVKREVATVLARRHLLNPRRYGAFAWILLGHKLGRWLSPWALLGVVAGLALLAPESPEAALVLAALGGAAVAASAVSWLIPAGARRLAPLAAPGRIATTAVAVAHAGLSALRVRPEPALRPIRRSGRHVHLSA